MGVAAMTQVEPMKDQAPEESAVRRSKKKPVAIVPALEAAVANLFWISETDAAFDLIQWPDKTSVDQPIDAPTLQQWLGLPEDTAVETCELESFFAIATESQDWHGEEEKAIVKRYQALVKLLTTGLNQCQVFRFGTINIEIYIVGQTPDKLWLGLHTQAVET
ncbi:MAG: nuclease [Alkalinema sp. RU_4_3]|nr:nuclease [Alkalinema sp. RU_4_3]